MTMMRFLNNAGMLQYYDVGCPGCRNCRRCFVKLLIENNKSKIPQVVGHIVSQQTFTFINDLLLVLVGLPS